MQIPRASCISKIAKWPLAVFQQKKKKKKSPEVQKAISLIDQQ